MKESHAHVIACLRAELASYPVSTRIQVLDAGCGSGGLIADAMEGDANADAGGGTEWSGFEVMDHAAGRVDFRKSIDQTLASRFPSVDWAERIRVSSAEEEWPFEKGSFDFVASNQVIEHVADVGWFFEQQYRVLKPGGIAIHHFPSAESWVDPHSGVPFAHWPRSDRNRARLLRVFSRFGLGKFPGYRRDRGHSLEAFVDEFTAYLRRYTYFRPLFETIKASRRVGFVCVPSYNGALARRWLSGDWEPFPYRDRGSDWIWSRVLSRVASATIVCRKPR